MTDDPNRPRPRTTGLDPWLIIARNAIPVYCVFKLGWPPSLALLEIWFDGVTTGAAMTTMLAVRDRRARPERPLSQTLKEAVGLLAIVWVPYVILALWMVGRGVSLRFTTAATTTGEVLLILAFVFVSNFAREARRNYVVNEKDPAMERFALEFTWDISAQVTRFMSLFLLSNFLRSRPLIVALAVVLAYVEIFPTTYFKRPQPIQRKRVDSR